MWPQRWLTAFRFRPWRAVAAALLLAALAQPGAAPLLAAPGVAVPAATGPLAPQSGCGVVVNNSDNAVGSLRWTVGCVAAGATVTFQPSLAGQTIVLTGTEISIAQSITIDGSAAPGVIVDAGNNSRIFNISASGPVTLTALTLQHGNPNGNGAGGAVFDSASSALTLIGVNVLSSTVTAGTGGGLFTNGPLTLTNTYFISNTSNSNGAGAVAVGAAVVSGGSFQRNTCTSPGCDGALFGFGTLTISGTKFVSNMTTGNGGGAYATGAAALTGGSFQGNQCTQSGCQGGGLFGLSTLAVTGTQFISNTSVSSGGALYASGAAALTNGLVQGNRCTDGSCRGGGLFGLSTLAMTGTQFISNTSQSFGGGAYATGAAEVTNATFQGNSCRPPVLAGDQVSGISVCQGGGLFSTSSLTLTNSLFISNIALHSGGGVIAFGSAVVAGSLFQGNRCIQGQCLGGGLAANAGLILTGTNFISNTSTARGGGVFALGALLVTGSRFEGNACTQAHCLGGGLIFAGTHASVLGSSFSGNQSAGQGGGVSISATAQLTLANVTLSDNLATTAGGGLFVGGASRASLYNVSVADNQAPSGGGLRAEPAATVGVSNTLFSNNTSNNCSGPISFGTHNLEFPGAICAAVGPGAGFTTGDPQLLPLALNAPGVTLTQALGPDSLARDHGNSTVCAGPLVHNVDQRGVTRPIDGDLLAGAICDIGAYEAAAPVWLLLLPLFMR